jgi:hypothetical protein
MPVGLGIEFVGVGPAERAWLEAVVARQHDDELS